MFRIHENYVRVDWPDSQDFEEYTEDDGILCGNEAGSILVPKTIYDEVYSQ